MFKKIGMLVVVSALITGCASVPMESAERTITAKKFNPPSDRTPVCNSNIFAILLARFYLYSQNIFIRVH